MYSKELVYVTTIAESGSLSAAAKKLSMTQPALSIFLSNLEVELEAPLFTRNGRLHGAHKSRGTLFKHGKKDLRS